MVTQKWHVKARKRFQKVFCLCCKAILEDACDVDGKKYWCPYASTNTVLTFDRPLVVVDPQIDWAIRGLCRLDIVSSVRVGLLSKKHSLPATWNLGTCPGNRRIYLLRDSERLKTFSVKCPVKTLLDWQGYSSSPGFSSSFDDALRTLISVLKTSKDSEKLALTALAQIKQAVEL